MLTITPAQFKNMQQAQLQGFVATMNGHLERFYPDKCMSVGSKVDNIIHMGINKASGYGINTQADVCLFITLMFEFGLNFDTDSRLPWVKAILLDSFPGKMPRLYRMAIYYVEYH